MFFCILGLAALRSGSRILPILMIMNGQLYPHFTIEYRKHFTGFHAIVVETVGGLQIGATECCVIMYGVQWGLAMLTNTNEVAGHWLDLEKDFGLPISLQFTVGDIIALGTFILSLQYNIGNFYYGLSNAEDKMYAVMCILPFIYCNAMIIGAWMFSQFWEQYAILFIMGVGMLITNVTGNFNLKSSAKMRLFPVYLDPLVFAGVLFCDYNRLIDKEYLMAAYVNLLINRTCQYMLFMKGMITQICEYMDLPFLTVK